MPVAGYRERPSALVWVIARELLLVRFYRFDQHLEFGIIGLIRWCQTFELTDRLLPFACTVRSWSIFSRRANTSFITPLA